MNEHFEYTRKLTTDYAYEDLETVALLLEGNLSRTIQEGKAQASTPTDRGSVSALIRNIVVEALHARALDKAPELSIDEIIQEALAQRLPEILKDSRNARPELLLESNAGGDSDMRYRALDLLREKLTHREKAVAACLVERYQVIQGAPVDLLLELAGLVSHLWPKETDLLLVYFFGGQDPRTEKLMLVANQWHDHCRIRFEATDDPDEAHIRVSFEAGGSWSYIGTAAQAPKLKGKPTMNFSWLEPGLPDEEYQQVVLHEFGHALGMVHEHQASVPPINWDVNYVRNWCALPPNNWSPEKVQLNIFDVYDRTEVNHSGGFDKESIMVYCVPPEFTVDRVVFPPNMVLSLKDIEHIGKIYPKVASLNS